MPGMRHGHRSSIGSRCVYNQSTVLYVVGRESVLRAILFFGLDGRLFFVLFCVWGGAGVRGARKRLQKNKEKKKKENKKETVSAN